LKNNDLIRVDTSIVKQFVMDNLEQGDYRFTVISSTKDTINNSVLRTIISTLKIMKTGYLIRKISEEESKVLKEKKKFL
jgi:hypothetical protein